MKKENIKFGLICIVMALIFGFCVGFALKQDKVIIEPSADCAFKVASAEMAEDAVLACSTGCLMGAIYENGKFIQKNEFHAAPIIYDCVVACEKLISGESIEDMIIFQNDTGLLK